MISKIVTACLINFPLDLKCESTSIRMFQIRKSFRLSSNLMYTTFTLLLKFSFGVVYKQKLM